MAEHVSHSNLVVWPRSPRVPHRSVVKASNRHLEGHAEFDFRWECSEFCLRALFHFFFINCSCLNRKKLKNGGKKRNLDLEISILKDLLKVHYSLGCSRPTHCLKPLIRRCRVSVTQTSTLKNLNWTFLILHVYQKKNVPYYRKPRFYRKHSFYYRQLYNRKSKLFY